MKTIQLKIEIKDSNWFQSQIVKRDDGMSVIVFDDAEIIFPPHYAGGKQMLPNEMLDIFLNLSGNVAVSLVSAFLYDALKSGKMSSIRRKGKKIESKEEIENALNDSSADDK